MECDVPNEVMLEPEIPKDVRTSEFFMFNEGPDVLMCSQPTVHAEIRLTRGCTASRDTIYRAVEAYLRARQGTCTLPTLLEPSLLSDLPSAAERTFFTENIASISVRFHSSANYMFMCTTCSLVDLLTCRSKTFNGSI